MKDSLVPAVGLLLAFLTGMTGAFGSSTPESSSEVFGSWVALDGEDAGMTMVSIFAIHPDHIEIRSTCSYGEFTVVAQAQAPIRISESEIEVLEARNVEKEHSPGFLKCRAAIRPMTVGYEVRGDTLVMSMAGTDKTHELPRVTN